MRSALILYCVLSLSRGVVGEIASAASQNHAPLLSHPQGLTADRKSMGALSLKLPPGYVAKNAASHASSIDGSKNFNGKHIALSNQAHGMSLHAGAAPAPTSIKSGHSSPQIASVVPHSANLHAHAAPAPSSIKKGANHQPLLQHSLDHAVNPHAIVGSSLLSNSEATLSGGNHKALLSHPPGQTADNKSQGARDIVMPHGASAQKASAVSTLSHNEAPKLRTSASATPTVPKTSNDSWWAKLFGRKDGPKAPERVTVWDIDMESTAVKKENRITPPQHLGALFAHGIPADLRKESSDNGFMSKFLKLVYLK